MATTDLKQYIKKSDIQILKHLTNPPEPVKLLLEAICISKGIQPRGKDYWAPSKKMMADSQFFDSLVTFDKVCTFNLIPAHTHTCCF